MFFLNQELISPTAINFVIKAKLLGKDSTQLITIKANIITIYDIVYKDKDKSKKTLELITQETLQGEVIGLNSVKLGLSNDRDLIVIAFKEAKCSILEFNLNMNKLCTLSMHYFERDEFKTHVMTQNIDCIDLKCNTERSCIAYQIYTHHLVILPFKTNEDLIFPKENGARKTPFIPSFILNLLEFDKKMKRIVDLCFLNDYNRPTIAILYEKDSSSIGSLYKADICSIIVISIDIHKQTHPVIFNVNGLPTHSLRLHPLRKPCGGFLLVTANSIIHIDQGHVGHTAMVNKFSKKTTHLKMSQVLSNNISLERSISISLDPQEIVFILKGGEIYRLGLRMDGKRLNRMIWELLGKSVPATSGIALDDSPRIFLGSELSKSCMIKFEKSHIRNVTIKQEKTDIFNHLKANDNTEVDVDLYGHDKPSQDSQQPKKMIKTDFDWEFKIEHEISNLGPINDYAIGPSHHAIKDKRPENVLMPHDILLCSGVGKYGSLNIVNQHIYPESGNSFSLPGCKGLWTLKSATEETHDHLIISKSDRTLVLSSGDELQEIKAHKLYSQGPTIALGEFPSFRVFVQVYKTGLRLIDSRLNTLICSKTVARNRTADMWVSSASILEPYVLLHHQSGSVTLLKFNNEASELITIEPKFDDNQKKFQCGALFSGSTDLFVSNEQLIKSNSQLLNKRADKPSSDINNQNSSNDGARKLSAAEIEQEDLDLYGTGATEDNKSTPTANSPMQLSPRTDPDLDHVKPTTSEIFLTLIDPSGNMQLFSLPSGGLCALFPKISLVPTLLNQLESQASGSTTVSSSDVDFNEIEFFNVEEKLYMILGSVTTEIFVYEFFLDRSLPIHSPWIADHPSKLATKLNRVSINYIPDISNETSQEANMKRFFPFENISGRSGVFILDKEPSWIIGNSQRGINRYPTHLPNDIISFSAYNTNSCSNGFVYCTKSGNLKTCQLPSGFEYEFQWTHKTIQMDRNPQKITHHLGSNTYLLASSDQQPFGLVEDSTVQQNQDSNDPIEILTKFYDSNNPPPYLPTTSKYQLDLISPLTWKPVDTFEFNDNEIVSCICSADLETKQTQSGRKNYIVVGTIISMGEDLAIKGKLYVFDVIEVVPEPGKPETGHKLKKIAVIDAKGPVTALAHSQGYLFTGMGNKLIMRKFEDDTTLEGVAFFDLQVYITTITVCKNFLLVGDLYKSAWFLGFQLEPTKIILLGKDYHPCQVMSSEILIQNNIMNFLISDELGNDIVLSYNPNNLQSFSGNKLVFKGDFHTNRRVVKWMRIPAKSVDSSDGEPSLINTFYCLGVTLEGALIQTVPITETTFRRLSLLYNTMVNGIPNLAGLNPKSFRLISPQHRLHRNPVKGVIDGNYLNHLLNLDYTQQSKFIQLTGTTKISVLNNLKEIQTMTSHF